MKFLEWLINEMPITSFQLKGNWENGKKYGYTDKDIGILTNPKGVAKIYKSWSNTKENFDLYFLRSYKAYKQDQLGVQTAEQVKEKFDIDIIPNAENITVLYLNNKAADRMPMNSWTLAHRMGHAFMGINNNHEIIKYLENEIKRDFMEILTDVYRREYPYSDDVRQLKDRDMLNLAYAVATMKSARDRNMRSFYELIYELIAQYINTGKIKFNPLPINLISKKKYAWGRPDNSHYRSGYTEDELEGWNDNIQDLASKYENILDQAFDSLRGEILVM